ncbi:phosphate signaling complex protein PhoU [Coraliomargarita parva]|uniref:phosphate signaling complex protein PhoU n=1 Tax=Coraliomargarita parva TaxID=3014050 RepID=UPI0022B3263F|nr:phosphate signaling complex protein PhoU [Coraliomargarita parva]
MKRYFHNELQDIRTKLILLGEKAIEAGRMAISGFLENDLEKIEKALKLDDEIDNLEIEIDRAAVRYTTLRGPVSSDVRLVFVAIKASHDFERAGDEAHSIAKKARTILTNNPTVKEFYGLERMSALAFNLMQDAISCFVDEDIEKARDILKRDAEIDRINKQNFTELAGPEASASSLDNATRVNLILISKSLERIGDHAKNLAMEVIYLHTGE